MVDTVSARSRDQQTLSQHRDDIVEMYKNTHNVSLLLREFDISRNCLQKLLKDVGIYEPSSILSRKARALAIKVSMQDKYGIDNPGQFQSQKNALQVRNGYHKTYLQINEDFKEYSEEVDYITNKNKKYIIDSHYCFYTGIKFIDYINETVNPNDPLKRTIDHKLSKLDGFYSNTSPEIIGSKINLVYCLRYCNSIKGNMSVDSFQLYAKQIRERLINEGCQSN
jgi:hypothetical protein